MRQAAAARRFAGLGRDARGVSIIEFAFLAPILVALVMGITDLARGFSAKLTLEQAASRALEKAAVGTVQSDYSFVRTEAATAAGIPESQVTLTYWLECDKVKQTSFDGVCPDGQQVARYLQVSLTSYFSPIFSYGPLGSKVFKTNADGTVTLTGQAALRVQ